MANKTVQNPCIQENPEADECQENIAPEGTAAAGEVQVGDMVGYSSTTQTIEENESFSKTCTFSTPAPTNSNGAVKAKSWISGLQFKTPILKYLNSRSRFGQSLTDKDAPVCWLDEEYFPEITLLDVTQDSTMQLTRNDSALPDSAPATPITATCVNGTFTARKPFHLSSFSELLCLEGSSNAPLRWLDDRYFPEITLLDVTQDSELSPRGEMSHTQDILLSDNLKNITSSVEVVGEIMTQPNRTDVTQSEELSSTLFGNATYTKSSFSEQSDKCAVENVMKVSLTQDISVATVLENSGSSTEPSDQNIVKSQTSAEDSIGIKPANVTRDISSSSDVSAQCTSSQLSSSDMQCNISLKNVTCELHGEPMETSNTVEAQNEELLSSHATEVTSKVPQPCLETAKSANNTFTIAQSSNLTAATDTNTTPQISSPLNRSLDLSPSNGNRPKEENDTKGQAGLVSMDTTETYFRMNQHSSAEKARTVGHVKNTTFDQNSSQRSCESSTLQETGLQNNALDGKPPSTQNGTITLSEINSSDSHQNTLDKPSLSEVCNPSTSPNSEVHPPESSKHNESTTSIEPEVKAIDTPEIPFEAGPVVAAAAAASEAGHHESKDQSQPGRPVTESFSVSMGHQSMDIGDNKANTFNLDETLDLREDHSITSTPMTNCKMIRPHAERENGKSLGTQKKLYGDVPSKPVVQVPSNVPSNIVCDRKTFLTQPAVKSHLMPLKAASLLLKNKPASTHPGSLPMTRQRTHAEALKNAAAPNPAQTVGCQCSLLISNLSEEIFALFSR